MLKILIDSKGKLPFQVTKVTVEKAAADEGQKIFIDFQRARDKDKGYQIDHFNDNVVYVLKIYLDKIMPTTSSCFQLYVGDHEMVRYSGFDGGIYTIIQNPRFFEKYQGMEIIFKLDRFSNKTFRTGVFMPEVMNYAPEEGLLSVEEVLMGVSGNENRLSL